MSKYKPGDKFEIEVIREDEELKSFYVTSVGLLHEKTLNSLRKIEPEVDWSKVEVDTPILVSNYSEAAWVRRYFAKYEDEKIYVWGSGATSWSAEGEDDIFNWEYAKLAEVEE